ncbi:MAG: ATP-binding protein [Firmicutes bacterium]|nr:ATP-binding protein [Bacillota bacterium]
MQKMDTIKEILEKQEMDADLRRKVLGLNELRKKKDLSDQMERSKSQKLISKCQYDNCDGSGMVVDTETNTAKFCKCHYDKIMENKLAFANIPKEFEDLTIGSFMTDCYSNEEFRTRALMAKKAAVNFINNYEMFKEKGKGLYFYSYVKGSGKTRLAASLGNALIKVHRARVKYTTTLDLLDEIKATYNKDSALTENKLLEAIKQVDVLILDDIGVEEPTSWVREKFYNIINGRMISNKITIFTSNSMAEELKHDDRVKNRIEKMAIPVYLPDESIRSAIAKKENEDLQEILFK